MPKVTETSDGLTFSIRVQPNAPRSKIVGAHGDAVKVALAAPPVDGKANAECIRFFAELFQVRRSDVEILAGEASRTKVVRVRGGARSQLEAALAPLADEKSLRLSP
jgi:uncharacterized protein (TIGR00251 family)